MSIGISFRPIMVLALSIAALQAASAAEPAHPCASVVDPTERLGCYDRAFPPSVDATTVEKQARQDFGLNTTEIRERNPDFARAAPPDRIEASVVALRGGLSEGRIIELDNGQVWRQIEANSRAIVDVGDKVSIKKSPMSSAYMLVTTARVPLRVKRIK